MSGILIKYNSIPKKCKNIHKKIGNQPDTFSQNIFTFFLVILTKNKEIQTMLETDQIDYLNSSKLLVDANIYYLVCKEKELCEIISPPDENFGDVLSVIYSKFSSYTILWISVDLKSENYKEKMRIYVENGFGHPYIVSKSPLQKVFPEFRVALLKKNQPDNKIIEVDKVFRHINYVINQVNNRTCKLYIRLNKISISYLKSLLNAKKEMSGNLYISDIEEENGNIIFTIDLHINSVITGEEESVDVSRSLYNFHSHPKMAYINNNVTKGWPSNKDYVGFIKLHKTILHLVVTIEGIYSISFSSYWSSKIKDIDLNFVFTMYNIDHSENYTSEEYVEKVNKILCKGYPIFEVVFRNWGECTTNIFSISYSKEMGNCFPIDNSLKVN